MWIGHFYPTVIANSFYSPILPPKSNNKNQKIIATIKSSGVISSYKRIWTSLRIAPGNPSLTVSKHKKGMPMIV